MIGKLTNAGKFVGNFAKDKVGMASVGVVGIGAVGMMATVKGLQKGTTLSNPVLPTPGQTQGYGKRGMDSNRLNTENLVQNLHGNRRKF
jgi:hypothetical protein